MTKIRIESDSEKDRGKSFAGQKIKIVPKRKRRSSGGGGGSSSKKKTVVYVVSDSPQDIGRSFGGTTILSPEQYEEKRRSSGSSVSVQSRQPNQQERAKIEQQLAQEAAEREEKRLEARREKVERLESNKGVQDLNKRVQESVASEIRERQTQNNVNLRATSTPQQISEIQNQEATAITGRRVTFSLSAPKEPDEVNLNPLRLIAAPATLVYRTVSTGGGNIVQGARNLKDSVKNEGVLATGKNIVVGTLDAASRDPFGFFGESAALGGAGKVVKQAVLGRTTTVTPTRSTSQTVSVGTKEGSLGIESTRVQSSFDVESGVFRKKRQNVNAEAEGIINRETRALGDRPPQVQRPVENPLNPEFSETTVAQGKLDVRVEGVGNRKVNLDSLQQGNKQVTTVDKTTSVSQTERVGKLNNEDIFKTTTRDVKTGDKEVTLSKEVKRTQPGRTVSDDLFASASKSETDVFIKNKDLKPSQGKVIDTTATSPSQKLELGGPSPEIRIINPPKKKSSGSRSSSSPGISSSRPGTQQQVFQQQSKSQSSQLVPERKGSLSSEMRSKAESIIEQRKSTNVQIPAQVVKDIIVKRNSRVGNLFPGIAALQGVGSLGKQNQGVAQAQSPNQAQSPLQPQDQKPGQAQPQDQKPGQAQPQDQSPLFDTPSPNKSKNANQNILKRPVPTTPPRIKIPFPVKTPFKFRLPGSGFQPKSQAAYDVFIMEKGKKIKANSQPIPYNMALKQGKNVVDNTIAASFELEKRGTSNIPDIPSQVIGDKFRARKTKNALKVVEKSKNRIDTPGEKQGLSTAKFLKRFKL